MIYIQLLPLLLLLVIPSYINGKALKTESESTDIGDLFNSMQNFSFSMQNFSYTVFNTLAKLESGKKQDKANEELKAMVTDLINDIKAQSEIIKEQGEKIQDQDQSIKDQDQNIRDLHKSLDKRLRENDLKIEWALTDGTLAPKNTSGIMENLARQEKKIDETLDMLRKVGGYTFRPGSCADIDGGNASGIHHIFPNYAYKPVKASCQNSYGGGWTVIQKRFNGSIDFYRGWVEYAEGFGDPAGEYWLGLRHIHALTQAHPMELYVGVTDSEQRPKHAKYASFSVSSEQDKFRLWVSGYSGTAGDKLNYHNGQPFSTKDQDNDSNSGNCSIIRHSAWWYGSCSTCDPNGPFTQVNSHFMYWDGRTKSSVMMIRPSNFRP